MTTIFLETDDSSVLFILFSFRRFVDLILYSIYHPISFKMACEQKQQEVLHDQENNMDSDELKSKANLFEGYEFDKKKIEDLFLQLDKNEDGRVDVVELQEGLHRLGIHHLPGHAEVITVLLFSS